MRRNELKTIGYIAQDVAKHLPNACKLQNGFVPDEGNILEDLVWEDGKEEIMTGGEPFTIQKLYLTLRLEANHTGNVKFVMWDNDDELTNEVDLQRQEDEAGYYYEFEKKWINVIVWGKEINDFHTIDKDMIFALSHSAIQELSRKNDVKSAQIVTLQTENTAKTAEISELKNEISLIKQHLGI